MTVLVLIIGPVPPPKGGVSIHIERLTRVLKRRGIEHQVLDEAIEETPGVANLRRIKPWSYFAMIRTARIVHIHSFNHFVRLLHTICARVFRCRVVHTVHSARGGSLAISALRIAVWLGHACVGVSSAVAARVGGDTKVVPAFIAPDPADETICPLLEQWLLTQRSAGRWVIAMSAFDPATIGGVDLYGLDMIVDAITDPSFGDRFASIICLSKTGPNEEYFNGLQLRVEGNDVSDRLVFVTEQVSFPGVLKRCDVFVRPTITDGDALSIREALWYGIPAVASDVVMRPESTVVFETRNVEQMKQAIQIAVVTGARVESRRQFADEILQIYAAQLSRS